MKKLYKNWHVHNILGHPLMHILNCIGFELLANKIHDGSLPEYEDEVK